MGAVRRLVGCNAESRNMEHGYEACEGNPILKEGKIRIRKQIRGHVGFVIMRIDEERGVHCNAVRILESERADVQRDVSVRTQGGAAFQEATDLRATHTPHGKTLHLVLKQTVFFRLTTVFELEEHDLVHLLWTLGAGEKRGRESVIAQELTWGPNK